MRRLVRFGLPSLALLAAGALALPAVRAAGSASCRPRGWVEWHLAMAQQCLEPRWVCEHMTSAELLRDPEIAAAYRQGLEAGRPEPVRGLGQMVGRMRASYGCQPEPGARPGLADRPADRLPPGHPPVGGSCPFAGPDAGGVPHPAGPLPFAFEPAPSTTL